MTNIIVYLNLAVGLASAVWGVIALYRPKTMFPAAGATNGERFFALLYAGRAVPFGLAVGILPLAFHGWPVATLIFAAALVQLIDVGIALSRRITGMAIGAAVATLVHLACGLAIL